MFRTTYGSYTLTCMMGGLPDSYPNYCRHAQLVSEYDLLDLKETPQSESPCFVGVSKRGVNNDWPFLIIAQRYSPDFAGFYPGAIIVPETNILMLGAGERLLAYTLDPPRLLWEDSVDFGFWGWEQHDNVIVMAAELEMAAWNTEGQKLWSHFVEPPWTYYVEDSIVFLDIMGSESSFPLIEGPDGGLCRSMKKVDRFY